MIVKVCTPQKHNFTRPERQDGWLNRSLWDPVDLLAAVIGLVNGSVLKRWKSPHIIYANDDQPGL